MTSASYRLLERLDRNDRQLLEQLCLSEPHQLGIRWFWVGVTQLGSAAVTILTAVTIPVAVGPGHSGAWLPACALAASHLVVQLAKRLVQRGRPTRPPVIPCPDRFSFPSGHATSSLAIALSVGLLLPMAAPALVLLGLLVGWSRVVLGVHYPGDVLAGQLIAMLSVLALASPF